MDQETVIFNDVRVNIKDIRNSQEDLILEAENQTSKCDFQILS